MNDQQKEVLRLLQEEAAEVIVAASKIRRFGVDAEVPGHGVTALVHLQQEIIDFLLMVAMLAELSLIDETMDQDSYIVMKREKLKLFTTLDPDLIDRVTELDPSTVVYSSEAA